MGAQEVGEWRQPARKRCGQGVSGGLQIVDKPEQYRPNRSVTFNVIGARIVPAMFGCSSHSRKTCCRPRSAENQTLQITDHGAKLRRFLRAGGQRVLERRQGRDR